jgi:hypothetical protein
MDPQGQRFHRSGPWLIISGRDSKSRAAAEHIAELCGTRGVACEQMTADGAPPCRIDFFFGLVVVLPTDITGVGARSIDRIGDHIRAYRARHRCGLDHLRQGAKWYEAGVVQVFDLVGGDAIEKLGSARRAACRLWTVAPGEAPTPFKVYDSMDGAGIPANTADVHAEDIDTLWRRVLSWGVAQSTEQVAAVRRFIEELRDRWEDTTRYPVLNRPVPGVGMNRFDFVLDKPATFRPDTLARPWRKWKEDGQRTVSGALQALAEEFPNVRRPPERAGKRDLQQDFYEFYQALRTLDELVGRTTR